VFQQVDANTGHPSPDNPPCQWCGVYFPCLRTFPWPYRICGQRSGGRSAREPEPNTRTISTWNLPGVRRRLPTGAFRVLSCSLTTAGSAESLRWRRQRGANFHSHPPRTAHQRPRRSTFSASPSRAAPLVNGHSGFEFR
jgi:hypothetical protein